MCLPASDNFKDTLDNIIKSLNKAGYSKRDYRVSETQETQRTEGTEGTGVSTGELFDANTDFIKVSIDSENAHNDIVEIEQFAKNTNSQYEAEMIEAEREKDETPNEIKDMVKFYKIKEVFVEYASKIKLPVFVKKIDTTSIFEVEGTDVPINKTMLSEGFDLSAADRTINFTRTEAEARMIDLDSQNEYIPIAKSLDRKALETIRSYFDNLNTKSKKKQLSQTIARNIRINEIPETQIVKYILDVIDKFDDEALSEMMLYSLETTNKVKQKIISLLTAHQEKVFNDLLDIGKIKCGMPYEFPSRITYKKTVIGLSKGLYTEEDGDINDFEYKVISAVANLDNVVFWHRNPERAKGFCINGYINHYPDFIIYLRSGKIILMETKGDDRDNTDSRRKVDLGQKWANKAGDEYRYFMVFDKTEMEGAITLTELLDKIKRM